jgi:hypothetical protein
MTMKRRIRFRRREFEGIILRPNPKLQSSLGTNFMQSTLLPGSYREHNAIKPVSRVRLLKAWTAVPARRYGLCCDAPLGLKN